MHSDEATSCVGFVPRSLSAGTRIEGWNWHMFLHECYQILVERGKRCAQIGTNKEGTCSVCITYGSYFPSTSRKELIQLHCYMNMLRLKRDI